MQFICYEKCGTCKKAQKWLNERGIEVEVRDIKTEKPTLEEIKEFHRQSGLSLKRFYNTSGTLYKSMALKDKIPTMTETEQYELLATDGMLVKRPILVGKDFVLVGFKEQEWVEKLGK